jgi:hypothetical protein
MKKIYKVLFLLSVLMLLFSCDKDDTSTDVDNTKTYSNRIILNDLKITGDSVKLSWSKLDTINFTGYLIVRKNKKDLIVNPNDYNNESIISRIYDPSITSFVDKDVLSSPYLEYQVIGLLSNNYIFSNSKPYERPDLKVFNFGDIDVLPDLTNNKFYFIEKGIGKISIFNFESLTVEKSISVDTKIGFCSFGTYNNVRELYVPRSDGWVFVYNSETLQKIDQIDIGRPSSCVVSNNGNLFVSTSAWINQPLKVFNRATKMKVSENGDFEDTRIRIIPNSNSEIIEVTINIGPTDLHYYKFDSSGNFVSQKSDRYHGDYPLDASVFQFFPDGKKFITSNEGAIYDVDLNYLNRLPKGDFLFSDYAFNLNSTIIYGGCSNSKSIVSYSIPNYEKIKEYKTQGYPYKMYRKDNVLICISKTKKTDSYYYNVPSEMIIEKIQL